MGDFEWEKILEDKDLMSGFQKELLAKRQSILLQKEQDVQMALKKKRTRATTQVNNHMEYDFLNVL